MEFVERNPELCLTGPFLENICRSLFEALLIIAPDYTVREANDYFFHQYGLDREKTVGRKCYQVLHRRQQPCPEDPPCPLRAVLGNGEPMTVEHVHQDRDGNDLQVEIRAFPLSDLQGRIRQVAQIIHDTSDRRRAEITALENERKYRMLFETIQDAILIFDAETRRFVEVNEAATRIYGFTREEFLDMRHGEITMESEASDRSIRDVLAGEYVRIPLRYHRKKDGTVFPVEISASSLTWQGREFLCGVVRDITARKQVEEELYRHRDSLEELVKERTRRIMEINDELRNEVTERRRMEEELRISSEKIKLFAYSVAHDLKSPAVAIQGLTSRLCNKYGQMLDDRGRACCEQISKSCDQITGLIEKINLYISSKESPLTIERVDLKEVIRSVREEFAAPLHSRRTRWVEPDDLPIVWADRLAIIRVLRNLVDNALKYAGNRLSRIEIGYQSSARHHILSVTDDGVGLAPEDSQKIFDLFVRKQEPQAGEGLGLGLAIVREIVEQHRGEIRVEPGRESGVTFSFSIAADLPEIVYAHRDRRA